MAQVAETRVPDARRPDWAWFVLFTAALSSLVYGLIVSLAAIRSQDFVVQRGPLRDHPGT
jgi:hypothetical protein